MPLDGAKCIFFPKRTCYASKGVGAEAHSPSPKEAGHFAAPPPVYVPQARP